jgi:hypothetical protein
MWLIFSHLPTRNPVSSEKISPIGRAVDPAAAPSKVASTVTPLLNHDHPHFFGFRSHVMTVPSTKNLASRLEDNLSSGINIASLSAGGGGAADVAWRHRVHQRCLHHLVLFQRHHSFRLWRMTVGF